MTRNLIGIYDLLNRQTQEFEDCTLYEGVEENAVEDFSNKWRPIFDSKHQELSAAGAVTIEVLREHGLEDSHWKWPAKIQYADTHKTWDAFSVECAGVTQGLMLVRPAGLAREATQLGLPLTIVDFVATAPWNRPKLVKAPKYKGVGHILLAAAVSLSMAEEQKGRIGLYALPGAASWYRDECGMTDLGYDQQKKMNYFEMTGAQAAKFIS